MAATCVEIETRKLGDIVPVYVGETRVEAREADWEHASFCLNCSREDFAGVVVHNLLNPEDNRFLPIVNCPDLGKEHVSFIIDGNRYDFSLFGPMVVQLAS